MRHKNSIQTEVAETECSAPALRLLNAAQKDVVEQVLDNPDQTGCSAPALRLLNADQKHIVERALDNPGRGGRLPRSSYWNSDSPVRP